MQVNAATSTTPSQLTMPSNDTTQTFLTLLVTQLKAQDPTNPMDPKEMVSQLVQFNTLGQIMSIREILETQVKTEEGGK